MRIVCWNWAMGRYIVPALYALWLRDPQLARRLLAIREGYAS